MRCFLLTVLAVSLVATPALASVPGTVGYNGVLFKDGECPGDFAAFCGTKSMDMTFRYFASKDGADQVGVDIAISAVPVTNGYFHVELTPPGADATWLELSVDDGGGMKALSPRVALSAVPYALAAGDAATLGGQAPSAFVVAGSAGAVTTTMLADGSVTASKLGVTCTSGQVLKWIGTGWGCGALSGGGTVTQVDTGDGLTGGPITGTGTISAKFAGTAGDYGVATAVARSDHGHDAEYAAKALEASVAALQTTVASLQGTVATLQTQVATCQANLAKATTCPSDMVPVGDFCVDRYESSLWAKKVDDGTPIDCADVQKGVDDALTAGWPTVDIYAGYQNGRTECNLTNPPIICKYRQYGNKGGSSAACPGSECDDYDVAGFPDSGNWTKPLYACAIKGVYPSRSMTWFQAQQACVNAGKHLITNGEWQAAVAGTPDPGSWPTPSGTCTGDAATATPLGTCNTCSSGARMTGLAAGVCKSKWCDAKGCIEDMIGNLWEWVDLWGQAGRTALDVNGGVSGTSLTGQFGKGSYHTPWSKGYVAATTSEDCSGRACDGTWNVNGETVGDTGWLPGLPFAALRGGNWGNGTEAGAFAFNAYGGPSYWSWDDGARCARGL
jgi:formylglycine-generating enzyme required for sulfatase activity